MDRLLLILVVPLLAGCLAPGDTTREVHWAGPVTDLEAGVDLWRHHRPDVRWMQGETAMLAPHSGSLDPDGVLDLTRATFGHADRGWYVLFVQARSPDPWVLSWALAPEPIIVVFLPAVQDTALRLQALGHDVDAAQLAHRAMLHASGHLLGLDGCSQHDCGIMHAAHSHGILLLDTYRTNGAPQAHWPGPQGAGSLEVRRPV